MKFVGWDWASTTHDITVLDQTGQILERWACEVSGLPLFRGTFADPAAEKDREKSVTVEFTCAHQPVPPPAVPGVPFRPVVLEGMTVAPRAEASGQAKWITWVIRAAGMAAPPAVTSTNTPAPPGRSVASSSPPGKVVAA